MFALFLLVSRCRRARAILLIACAKSRTLPMLAITTITGAISGQTASCGCCLSLAESLVWSEAASIQKAQLKQFYYFWQVELFSPRQ